MQLALSWAVDEQRLDSYKWFWKFTYRFIFIAVGVNQSRLLSLCYSVSIALAAALAFLGIRSALSTLLLLRHTNVTSRA